MTTSETERIPPGTTCQHVGCTNLATRSGVVEMTNYDHPEELLSSMAIYVCDDHRSDLYGILIMPI